MNPLAPDHLRPRDWFVLGAFCVVLFAYACVSFKPLTMHEARLPELAREMLNSGQWLIPHSGGRPWVERPPLPQWVVAACFAIFGTDVWVARLPGALAGAITCLLTAASAARLLGRQVGLLTGFALATTYEFYVYATLAEDEVYLAALVAACVWAMVECQFRSSDCETGRNDTPAAASRTTHFKSAFLFFLLLSLTQLVRGPMVGVIQVGSIVGSFLLLRALLRRRPLALFDPWGPLTWLIGLPMALALGAMWYVYCGLRVPSLWDNLRYDYFSGWGADPWWYYGLALSWTTQPWTLFALAAIVVLGQRLRPARGADAQHAIDADSPSHCDQKAASLFTLCWAFAPVMVMSLAARKGHHYLVPVLAGWATLGAVGLKAAWEWGCARNLRPTTVIGGYVVAGVTIALLIVALAARGRIDGPFPLTLAVACAVAVLIGTIGIGASRRDARLAFAAFLATFLVIGCWQQTAYSVFNERRMADVRFARAADRLVPAGAPLFIVHKESLDFFLLQFYTRSDARLLHNPTWLLDERIAAPAVYVITRAYDRDWIEAHVGDAEELLVADYSRREEELGGEAARWTLLRVRYRDATPRFAAPPINAMQAMKRPDWRDESPYLGPTRPAAVPAR